jgi:uncharacterized protein YjbI with pentapeptide repeats
LDHSRFSASDFTNAQLPQARLVLSQFTDTTFAHANLAGADLTGAILAGCDLSGANLRGACLLDADLSQATIDGADFEGANTTGARWTGVDPSRAKGLALGQVAPKGAVGPNIQELENQAKAAQSLVLKATLDRKTGYIDLLVNYNGGKTFCHYTSDLNGNRTLHSGPHTVPLRDCLLYFGQRFPDAELRMDSIKVQAPKQAIGSKELKRLALAAWCEALGLEIPSDEDLKSQGKARKQDQEAFRKELLLELRQGAKGVEKWNARPKAERKKAGTFRHVDLSNAALAGADLQGLDLQEATFDGSNLAGANFANSSVASASFQGANLENACLIGSKGSAANFAEAKLIGANLRSYKCKRASFLNADLTSADFSYADISSADFTGATLSETVFAQAKFDEATRFPKGFPLDPALRWVGKGTDPRLPKPKALKAKGPLGLDKFMKRLAETTDAAKLEKALSMLKADRFKLYAQVADDFLVGVVKSQGDPDLVYSCRLASDGAYGCCTQNLNVCGGLRGSLCKHLLVLIIGLAKGSEFDLTEVDSWMAASRAQKPILDKESMSETFLRYKGAEAGEVDWRPTETIPEDYYTL